MKNATLKYYLCLLSFIVMPVCLIGGALIVAETFTAGIPFYAYIVLGIGIILALLGRVITKIFNESQMERDYDEFGINKKKSNYSALSRKEREAIDKQRLADMERILSSSELKSLTKKGSTDPDVDLQKLIGLRAVKEQVSVIAARMEFDHERAKKKAKTQSAFESTEGKHMIFIGPPGTGKTTVARIMCGFLFDSAVIKKNQIIEIDGNYLLASNAADTALKTELIIRKSYGGVLFIDEAYTLLNGETGAAAISTLNKAMEDRRNRFLLIVAGYDKEMMRLLNSNPGLASRFNAQVKFPNYSVDELCDIFTKMVNDNGMCISLEAMEEFRAQITREINEPNFGNARNIRRIVDKAISRHAYNIKMEIANNRYQLYGEDLREM